MKVALELNPATHAQDVCRRLRSRWTRQKPRYWAPLKLDLDFERDSMRATLVKLAQPVYDLSKHTGGLITR